jgi:hypothetical protein
MSGCSKKSGGNPLGFATRPTSRVRCGARETGLARARRPLPPDTSTFLAGAAFTTVALLVTRFARAALARG